MDWSRLTNIMQNALKSTSADYENGNIANEQDLRIHLVHRLYEETKYVYIYCDRTMYTRAQGMIIQKPDICIVENPNSQRLRVLIELKCDNLNQFDNFKRYGQSVPLSKLKDDVKKLQKIKQHNAEDLYKNSVAYFIYFSTYPLNYDKHIKLEKFCDRQHDWREAQNYPYNN